jgi:serine O-acetyltransferase
MGQISSKTRRLYWVRIFLNSTRLLPHLVLALSADKGGILKADLARWAEIFGFEKPVKTIDFIKLFIILMTFTPEFRNLFYFRLGLKAKLFSWMCPPLDVLGIDAKSIGPGLFIQHGIATGITADSIGANCWIGQQVTIGYTNTTDRPTIGNNVMIAPGARIFGNVKIGDNATIGPNTVVLDNVPPGATLLGVPGRVVWKGERQPRAAD